MEQTNKKLYRSNTDKIIAGVCGGLGKYFDIDPLIFRILFLIFVFGGGFGVLLYIILAIIMPSEPLTGSENGSGEPKNFKETVNEFAANVKENARDLANEARNRGNGRSLRNILGLFIVALGLFLLFGNLFPWFVRWDLFWPLVIILIGILIVIRRR